MSLTAELLLVAFLIVLNGVFVMSEMAIVSARKVRLQQSANQGDRRAGIALGLAMSPDRFLPTVQVGITLLVILCGARGESAISQIILPLLEGWLPAQYSQPISSAISIAIITYLTIVISELVPKQLALNSPEKVASLVAVPLNLLVRLATRFIFVLSGSTKFVV